MGAGAAGFEGIASSVPGAGRAVGGVASATGGAGVASGVGSGEGVLSGARAPGEGEPSGLPLSYIAPGGFCRFIRTTALAITQAPITISNAARLRIFLFILANTTSSYTL
jgi:hypothetical protein